MNQLPRYSREWYEALKFVGECCMSTIGFLRNSSDFLLSVIMPVYNEKATIRQMVEQVKSVPRRKEIVLIDDCSTDGSVEILRELEQHAGDAVPAELYLNATVEISAQVQLSAQVSVRHKETS